MIKISFKNKNGTEGMSIEITITDFILIYIFNTTTSSPQLPMLLFPSIYAGFLIHCTAVSELLQSDFTCPVVVRPREKGFLDISLETEDE